MSAEKILERLFKAFDTHWPYIEPHLEYSTDGYIFFRQDGKFYSIPFPIKDIITITLGTKIPKEGYVEYDEIEYWFKEFATVLIEKVDEENSCITKDETGTVTPPLPEIGDKESLDKFVYPKGVKTNNASITSSGTFLNDLKGGKYIRPIIPPRGVTVLNKKGELLDGEKS